MDDDTRFLDGYEPEVREQVDRFSRFCSIIGIEVEDFERLIVSVVFSGRREVLTLLPRKNGKTSLIACIVMWHLLTVSEPWVIAAASNHNQATTLLNEAKKLAQRNAQVGSCFDFPFDHLRVGQGPRRSAQERQVRGDRLRQGWLQARVHPDARDR